MRTLEIPEPAQGLPVRPAALKKFDDIVGTYDDEAIHQLQNGKTIVAGGLSLMGDEMHIVFSVGVIRMHGDTTPEKQNMKGWSLHLGHPDEKFRKLRYFDTAHSTEEIELPVPNYMVFFACETDPTLTEEDADEETLRQIAYFVLPFISDAGPPQGIDW